MQNIANARDYIDELATEVEELERVVNASVETIQREAAQTAQTQVRRHAGQELTWIQPRRSVDASVLALCLLNFDGSMF